MSLKCYQLNNMWKPAKTRHNAGRKLMKKGAIRKMRRQKYKDDARIRAYTKFYYD